MEEVREDTYNRPEIRRWEMIDAINKSNIPKIRGKKIAVRVKAWDFSKTINRADIDFTEFVFFVRKAYLDRVVNSKEFQSGLIPGEDSYVKHKFRGCREEYIPCVCHRIEEIPMILYHQALKDGEIQGYYFGNHDKEITWRGKNHDEEERDTEHQEQTGITMKEINEEICDE